MRFLIAILLLFILVGCNNVFLPTSIQSDIIYQENNDNEKIFSFGNPNSNNNVLIVLGTDIYNSRILNVGNQNIEWKLLNYIVNPQLNYYYPEDPYSDVYDSRFNGLLYKNWKDKTLDLNNSYYYIIVTNKEENIFDLIKSSNLVFNYFMMYFHGNRNYINSRTLTRNDIILNFNDVSIRNNFSTNCLSLIISCNIDGFNISGYSFATIFSYYIGVPNMIVSSSSVFDNLSNFNRVYYGDFKKVSINGWYNIDKAYMDYKAFTYENIVNSLRQKHLIVDLPISSINNLDYLIDKNVFYLVYSSYDNYYLNSLVSNDYCDIYLNYQTKEIVFNYLSKNNDIIVSKFCYKISSDYFNLFSFLSDIYGNNSIDYKYIELRTH